MRLRERAQIDGFRWALGDTRGQFWTCHMNEHIAGNEAAWEQEPGMRLGQ